MHDQLRVVLVGTRNPLNLGAAARAMSNFGFGQLRVVNPYEVAYREARSAVNAAELLAAAEEFTSVAEAVADCTLVVGTTSVSRRDPQHHVRRLETGARLIRSELRRSRVALLFGSEKVGLSNADLSHCHWLMRIPTREEHSSMNLGQAVAVCLYELVRDPAPEQKAVATKARRETRRLKERTPSNAAQGKLVIAAPARAVELERLSEVLMEALRASGYTDAKSAAATEEKVRRLVRRLDLQSPDADVLLGMLRQILWKLSS